MLTKIRQRISVIKLLAGAALVLLVMFTATVANAQQVTTGFSTDQDLQRGMIVSLDQGSNKINALDPNSPDKMYGVVVDPNDAPLTLSSEQEKVFVATSGSFEVLVSNQNGNIKSGDYITISSTPGIGMKADDKSRFVIGRALADYDGSSPNTQRLSSEGRELAVGRVLANISVSANPNLKARTTSLPSFLLRSAEDISGKTVSPTRVYLGSFIAVATVIISGSLLYGGVRSSIIAIGRNPLSKASVGRNMIKVVLVGLTIFICGLFAVYLIIKL